MSEKNLTVKEITGKYVFCVNACMQKIIHAGTVLPFYYPCSDTNKAKGAFFEETFSLDKSNIDNLEFIFKDYNISGYENDYNRNKVFLSMKEAEDYISYLRNSI